ncbi:YslB family protein [Pontibacillus litoralis]|uniref:Hydrocarbon binding protein n=1 Tax=Pontibacillus litoralis JSM 072002 TaxID=1385512 RepID=A0A0A5G7E6_9BACI|nr:YslB family protein [Pontibacillus litoralis]KGX89046.1 hypothetical protein N784_01585 [Pontibacillus litoralis JSM 072002]
MSTSTEQLIHRYQNIPSTSISHEVLRSELLADMLGKEAETILYIMGKNLARTYPCQSIEELTPFFDLMGWGDLIVEKQKKKEYHFQLSGAITEARLSYKQPYCYKLEAGFLAQQVALLNEIEAECAYETNKRKKHVQFHVVTL